MPGLAFYSTRIWPLKKKICGFLRPQILFSNVNAFMENNMYVNVVYEQVPFSCPLLLTRLLLGKYSRNFLIIQLERAAGLPGLVIVSKGKRAPTPLQTFRENSARKAAVSQSWASFFNLSSFMLSTGWV